MLTAQTSGEKRRLKNRRGAMLIMVAISMVCLLGLVAIATDVGSGNRIKRTAQTAADAGAMGGGRQIERGLKDASVAYFAQISVTKNGYAAGETTINFPPASGPFAGDSNYVEVIIAQSTPTLFGRIFNKDTIQIQARAVAGLNGTALSCIYNTAVEPEVGIDWDGSMNAGCGISSNGSIDIGNRYVGGGTVTAVGSISGVPSTSSYPGSPPIADPFASGASAITVPAETTCDYTNYSTTVDATIDPGVYCGGITISNTPIRTVTMRAGTYIIRGGGITGGALDATAGVTIINTNGMGNNQTAYRPITFGPTNCSFKINAPSSGQYKGIAVIIPYDAPVATSSSDQVNTFCAKGGGPGSSCDPSTPDVRGVVYMPGQTLNIGVANGKLTVVGAIISKYLTTPNSGAIACMYSDASSTAALKKLSLVE